VAVVLDIRDGAGLRYSGQGYEVSRIARVTELSSAAAYERSQEALVAAVVATGAIGHVHPGLPNCYCKAFEIRNEMTDVARVEIVYRSRPTVRITTESTLGQVTSYYDLEGNPITVVKDGVTQWVGVPMGIPQHRKVIEVELGYDSDATGKTYEGTVNQAGWSLDEDAPEGTWKCMSVRSTTDDLTWYQWVVEFEYRPVSATLQTNGWKEIAAYRDTAGNVPYDADPSAWFRWVEVAPVADFDAMPIYG